MVKRALVVVGIPHKVDPEQWEIHELEKANAFISRLQLHNWGWNIDNIKFLAHNNPIIQFTPNDPPTKSKVIEALTELSNTYSEEVVVWIADHTQIIAIAEGTSKLTLASEVCPPPPAGGGVAPLQNIDDFQGCEILGLINSISTPKKTIIFSGESSNYMAKEVHVGGNKITIGSIRGDHTIPTSEVDQFDLSVFMHDHSSFEEVFYAEAQRIAPQTPFIYFSDR